MTLPRPTLGLKSRQATAPAEAPAPATQPGLLPNLFWFNFREGGNRPRARHATRELALTEARTKWRPATEEEAEMELTKR